MHGPTFMANPLACSVALASLNLLQGNDFGTQVAQPGDRPDHRPRARARLDAVADVRVLGGVGVIQLRDPVDVAELTAPRWSAGSGCDRSATSSTRCRPTSRPPEDLGAICDAMVQAVASGPRLKGWTA